MEQPPHYMLRTRHLLSRKLVNVGAQSYVRTHPADSVVNVGAQNFVETHLVGT